ncbi:hypothetical protein RJ639_014809 [Escallonia herrerae]|uniref:Josephin-like protein n=1 Tax=Escallonia herrerae TaxID=1293975 RepID=A0AA88VG52_9ASTE|nr:hypothetical protein RJ639_014809 [Escallonia herrerae]
MVVREQRPQPRDRRSTTMKSYLCMPRFRGSSCSPRKTSRLSPAMSLLDRFREAVFRLIMLSALSSSKASQSHDEGRSSPANSTGVRRSYNRPDHDAHQSEAVADCIAFIKKSAIMDHENRDSAASSHSSIGAATEVVTPVPVM